MRQRKDEPPPELKAMPGNTETNPLVALPPLGPGMRVQAAGSA